MFRPLIWPSSGYLGECVFSIYIIIFTKHLYLYYNSYLQYTYTYTKTYI
jgi:hypothetical protein